jgi:hypothetical protein
MHSRCIFLSAAHAGLLQHSHAAAGLLSSRISAGLRAELSLSLTDMSMYMVYLLLSACGVERPRRTLPGLLLRHSTLSRVLVRWSTL